MTQDDRHTLVPMLLTLYAAAFFVSGDVVVFLRQLLYYFLGFLVLRILGKILFDGAPETNRAEASGPEANKPKTSEQT
ncbi:MAG: hypothetical protein AAF289_04255 [Cyanobacteria bacterium P01_A01_bin.135]